MTTPAPWRCGSCDYRNPSTRMTCVSCGQARVVNLGAPNQAGGLRLVFPGSSATPGSPAPQRPPADDAPKARSTVTRYLCCAVQLDAGLARTAIKQIIGEPRRAVTASPSVDLPVVLAYAVAAWRRQQVRDIVLALMWVVSLAVTYTGHSNYVFKSMTAHEVDLVGLVGLMGTLLIFLSLRWPKLSIAAPLLFVPTFLMTWKGMACLFLTWLVIVGESLYVHYRIIVPRLSHQAFNPNDAPAPRSPKTAARLKEIGRWDVGNVTVHQGFDPFAGFGTELGERPAFTVRTDKPAQDATTTKPFEIHDLYQHVASAVESLGLYGLSVENRVFVHGDDLRVHLDNTTRQALLPDPERAPASHVPPQVIRDLREADSSRARPYLVLHISGWEGEMEATQFVQFYLSPRREILHVQHYLSLLTPVRPAYRSVDRLLARPTPLQFWVLLYRSFPRAALMVARPLPGLILTIIGSRPWKDRMQRANIRKRTFNYSGQASIRETASDNRYYRHQQKSDYKRSTEIVADQVLNSLIDFLDQHDIDTTELRDQRVIYATSLTIGSNVSFVNSALATGKHSGARVNTGIWGGGPAGHHH